MKMKKITILASATLLGALTLTSCGETKAKEAEAVSFASYSTETTLDKYQEAHANYLASVDVSAGYDLTTYTYSSIDVESSYNYSYVTSSKYAAKYDKTNGILTNDNEYYMYDNEETLRDGLITYSNTYQKNNAGFDIINNNTKSYYSSDFSIDNYAYSSVNMSGYVDALAGSIDESDTTKQVKYYADNNVYTLKLTIKTETEHKEGTITLKENTSVETVFQFYVSNSEVYGKSTTDKVTELEYVDGDSTGKVKKTEKNVKYATLKIGAQTISKVDLSTYIKESY